MNHFAPNLDLRPDQDLVLGDVLVSASLNRIAIGNRQRRIEPRIMQVLLLLAQYQGQSVARDTILQLCWGGVFVAEDSLNRSIFQLRRALRDVGSTRVRVETIPKFGYALFVEAEAGDAGGLAAAAADDNAADATTPAAPAAAAPPPADPVEGKAAPRPRRLMLAASLVAALLVGAAGTYIFHARNVNNDRAFTAAPAFDVVPLTVDPGLELFPSLSRDGRRLAYAGRNAAGDFDIMLRSTAANSRPVSLASTPDQDRSPIWSPQDDSIAFLRSDAQWKCAFYVANVSVGVERRLGDCEGDMLPGMTWTPDGKALVYTTLPQPATRLSRLKVMPLDGGKPYLLPVPPGDDVSDSMPTYSPDGRRLAIGRSWPDGRMSILVLDAASGRELHRLPIETMRFFYDWSADGQGFYVAHDGPGRRGLWYVDIKSARWQQIIPGIGVMGRLSVARNHGNIAMEIYSGHADIVRFSAAGQRDLPVPSAANEYEPQISPDGRDIAFISDRTGDAQVWLSQGGNPPRPLTDIRGATLSSLRWSPDSRSLLFIAEVGLASDLYRVSVDKDETIRLTQDGKTKTPPAWLPDGSIRVPVRTGSKWEIWALDGKGGAPVRTGQAGEYVELSADRSRLLTGQIGDRHLTWTSLDGKESGTIALPVALRGHNVGVCADMIYAVRLNLPSGEVIAMDRQTGAEKILGKIPRMETSGRLSVDCAKGSVLTTQYTDQQSDIIQLTPILPN